MIKTKYFLKFSSNITNLIECAIIIKKSVVTLQNQIERFRKQDLLVNFNLL